MVKPVMRPSNSLRLPYMSTSSLTRWPMRKSANCVSLKLASIQISVSERIAISCCPTWTIVAGVDVAARDDAVDVATDVTITEVQFGLLQVVPGLRQLGFGLDYGGNLGNHVAEDPVDVSLLVLPEELFKNLLGRRIH